MSDEDQEEDIYNEEERERQLDDDEISAEEEGFTKGYNEEAEIKDEEE
jgi:hypothetical protein